MDVDSPVQVKHRMQDALWPDHVKLLITNPLPQYFDTQAGRDKHDKALQLDTLCIGPA